MRPNKNGDIFFSDGNSLLPGSMTNAPEKASIVAHTDKNTYEDLVGNLSKLMGTHAKISRNCTAIECPNVLLCLTRKMISGHCHTCGKRWICDAQQNPLRTTEEFSVPEACTGYEFDALQMCNDCAVKSNVVKALGASIVPSPSPENIKYDSGTGVVHVVVPKVLNYINVSIKTT